VEVDRLVNGIGGVTLLNRLILVGSPLAGQRARIRLDGQLMHVLTQDGVLWRTLPCPIPPHQRHRHQGVRLAGPAPLPEAAAAIQRRVSSRGGIQVARQRIQVGMTHAGKIATVVPETSTFRLVIDADTVGVVPRTTSHEIAGSSDSSFAGALCLARSLCRSGDAVAVPACRWQIPETSSAIQYSPRSS
jgi:hypothetical protein